jgi:hypothetical protein
MLDASYFGDILVDLVILLRTILRAHDALTFALSNA